MFHVRNQGGKLSFCDNANETLMVGKTDRGLMEKVNSEREEFRDSFDFGE